MKQLSYRELSVFCGQISMMIQAGILLHAGVQMIANDTTDSRKKAIYKAIADRLAEGDTLDVALQASAAFPQYMIRLTEIGSKSGKLDAVMEALASYYSRRQSLQDSTRSAVVYPLILIGMMLAVLVVLTSKVMPIFQQVFHSLGTDISPWAAAIMNLGISFSRFSLLFAVLFVLLFVALLLISGSEKGRFSLFSLVMGRKITEKFDIATFASSMSLMLAGGIDMDTAFRLSEQAVSGKATKQKIIAAAESMRVGATSLTQALSEVALLSDTMTGLLATASQSGSVDSALQYIADIYEEEYESAMMKRVALIEPISVALISLLIGFILISVMLPLLSILSGIG